MGKRFLRLLKPFSFNHFVTKENFDFTEDNNQKILNH